MLETDVPDASAPRLAGIEVVLVSYRSKGHVADLLSGWPADLSVCVVDNSGNSDGIAELVRAEAGQRPIRYVDGGGQGFARAANIGAASSTAEHVVFVNPDSRPTATQLETLVSGLRSDPGAVTHAGTPTDLDGVGEIGAGGWEPNLLRVLVYSSGLHTRFRTSGFFAKPTVGEPIEVDWACGACMAVRREQFVALGGFDETFYVYCEDMSFGRRARAAGLRSVLRTDVAVIHGAGSSGAPSLEMLRLRGASFAGYLLRYHPGPPAVAMRAVFAAGALLRGLAQIVRGDRAGGRLNVALAQGTLTRKAYVGGTEVARARFDETAVGPERRAAVS